jgi:phosphatidate cytidylyltransferase
MTPTESLFDFRNAFDDPITAILVLGIAGLLAVSGAVIAGLRRVGRIRPGLRDELWPRWKSWLWLAGAIVGPLLLGPVWTMAAILLLGLLCYREYAYVTGLRGDSLVNGVAAAGMLAVTLAARHGEALFLAGGVLTVVLLAGIPLLADRPHGYLWRVAVSVLGFALFGLSLGYLGRLAAAPNYRPLLLMVLLAVALNDVFAFCVGKAVGGPRLMPNTSPNKTLAGAAGALVLTALLVLVVGRTVFVGTDLGQPGRLLGLGLLIGVLGQAGDLVFSAIKRDLGIKDMGAALPGHGGLLDRFDSLVLVPAPVFYYLVYHLGPLDLCALIGS